MRRVNILPTLVDKINANDPTKRETYMHLYVLDEEIKETINFRMEIGNARGFFEELGMQLHILENRK
jgi:hypothetical protein